MRVSSKSQYVCKTQYFLTYTTNTTFVLREMVHHMCDSGESLDISVCLTISNMTSPSVCQLHDLSVCQPSNKGNNEHKKFIIFFDHFYVKISLHWSKVIFYLRDEFIWNSVHLSVCLPLVPSNQPSANFSVKIPTSIAGHNFLKVQFPG